MRLLPYRESRTRHQWYLIDAAGTQPSGQPMKHSQLRNMYQKTNVNFKTGTVSVNGFGFTNDGSTTRG
jgi:hypothetical protein